MNTPKTDAVRLVLHASFPDWREEAMDAIERYDTLSRTLERELSAKAAECQRLKVIAQRVVIADDGPEHPDWYEGMEGDTADAARAALQEVTP